MRAARLLCTLSLLVLASCSGKGYEVIERTQKEVSNFHQSGTHTEVHYVLMHDGHKIYTTCDAEEIDAPNASCGFRPLHTYDCTLGDDRIEKATLPLSDLKCKDADGRDVYLYVDRKE